MHLIDWIIVFSLAFFLIAVVYRTKKYSHGTNDFLAANRCAKRYLLGTAESAAGLAAISLVAKFETFYSIGFAQIYWETLTILVIMFISMSGWIIYRFRKTRALTMAEYFEKRYSVNFRIFTGLLGWISGVVNFGIFPGVSANFFINFCSIPRYEWIVGGYAIPVTYLSLMFLLQGVALFLVLNGGLISIIVTDFWQGIFTLATFMTVCIFIWIKIPWEKMSESIQLASQPGISLFNPFDIQGASDFNIWFFVIQWFGMFYSYMAWQGSSGYNSCATNAHEAKMGKVVAGVRGNLMNLGLILMPLAAITVFHHPTFSALAETLKATLVSSFPESTHLQNQMRVPTVLSELFPPILNGFFAATVFSLFLATQTTYLHSWGSIFVQDFWVPLQKKKGKTIKESHHLRLLQYSVAFVAVFTCLFSWFVPVQDYIFMFFAITGAIFVSGGGIVIIGGLYTRWGNHYGAWTAMIVGGILSLIGVGAQSFWTKISFLVAIYPECPINGQWMMFSISLICVLLYVLVSLLTPRPNINWDSLYYEGSYAIPEENIKKSDLTADRSKFWTLIGAGGEDFTLKDRILYSFGFMFTISLILMVSALACLHFLGWMNADRWLDTWYWLIIYYFIFSVIGGIWITIGGIQNIRDLFKMLDSKHEHKD